MILVRATAVTLTCLLVLTACRSAVQSDTPDAYEVRMAVTPAPGGPVQRVSLPAAVFVASQKSDLTDIRIFDASGKRLPTALVDDKDMTVAREQRTAVAAYPIVGPVSALRLTGVSLRLEDGERARIIGATGSLVPGGESNAVVGALLDTRAVSSPVTAITISAEVPEQVPVTLALESGSDLKNWEPLAQKVLFRPAGAAEVLGSGVIPLQSVNLGKRYVRVTWSGAPASSVRIRGAVVKTSTAPAPQRIDVPTTPPTVLNAHDVRFSLSAGTKLDAVNVTPAAADGVIPVRVFGRDTADEPWQPLGAAVVYGTGARAADGAGNAIELGGSAFRMYRLEGDARTAGFSKPPKLELLYRPASLIVLFNTSRPFTLAVGWVKAPDVFLTQKEIAPAENVISPNLPVATVAAPPPSVVLVPSVTDRVSSRSALLWAILALGAAVLLFATFTLFRKTRSPEILSR